MPKIKILHLYYDLMNLYGENANVRCLVKYLEREGVTTEVSYLSINDNINFNKYDVYYIGCGTEKSELLVLNDIIKYKTDITNAINKGKHFIITGNAIELFGKSIIDNNITYPGLNIFNYTSIHRDIRIVGSIVYKTKLIKEKIIGFQNRYGIMINNESPLFKVLDGTGSDINSKIEGYKYKNFYATYIIGPLLIRNPYLTSYIVKNIIKEKNNKYKFKIFNKTNEIKAYNTYLDNFNINKKS